MNLLKGKRKFMAIGVLLLVIVGIGTFINISNNQVNAQEEVEGEINSANFEEVSKKETISKARETESSEKGESEVDTKVADKEQVEEITYEDPIVQESTMQEEMGTSNSQTSNSNTDNNSSTNINNNNSNTNSKQNDTGSDNDNSTEIAKTEKPNKPTIPEDKACGYMSSSEALDHAVAKLGVGGGIGAQMSGFDCVSDYSWNRSEWEEVYKWDMPGYDFIADDGNTYLILGNGYIEQY